MADIYIKCGEYDKALDELETLLSQRTGFTANDFKLIGYLDPLRKLPRYQEMVKKYAL
ncbi:MAG: hypothetical protein HY851_07780 [candidate division Zixibacteria bacterium]|nr:hypothetical protein [candidate division Zixibacteria bacterium]